MTEKGRLRLAVTVVEQGWPLRRAAERFQVSVPTAKRWADRYRQQGAAGMCDRSSRPHRSPNATKAPLVRKIKHLRTVKRLGPAMIAGRLGMHASTVHRVLRREQMPRLAHLDRVTAATVRYERPHPGDLVHVDIKKLGKIPTGGSWRTHGRGTTAHRNRAAATTRRSRHHNPLVGSGYVHTALDDHSRLAYSEVLDDEKGPTAAGFWYRAVSWFAEQGITVTEVLTDNGGCYRSFDFALALATSGVIHRRTRPYRPQTNGKVERFNRTLLAEWAYAKIYNSERARRQVSAYDLTCRSGYDLMCRSRRGDHGMGSPPATRLRRSLSR